MPHPHRKEMADKLFIFQLPLQFKNESKYEDCISIMNSYESTLTKLFQDAHGNTDLLDKYKVTLGGDQLTRVRMQDAKDLKALSTTAQGRLAHLEPVVCELWHLKQDFLEKLCKTFYEKATAAEQGTLQSFNNSEKKRCEWESKVKLQGPLSASVRCG
ncbi:hypothetical protein FSP39_019826 [Pinctada imbricata]|uniref:DUF6589 domain-containing protein n=1 Tax=Pinctada imbricata TaxID=66713 RepID=A0AA89BTD5_PINIB|nr:hypothetical protein FSP39_019826 [Pinctada imbricata]